jgi:hypothetical protein
MTTTLGPVRAIGDGDHTTTVDIAPAVKDGQPAAAIWAGDGG